MRQRIASQHWSCDGHANFQMHRLANFRFYNKIIVRRTKKTTSKEWKSKEWHSIVPRGEKAGVIFDFIHYLQNRIIMTFLIPSFLIKILFGRRRNGYIEFCYEIKCGKTSFNEKWRRFHRSTQSSIHSHNDLSICSHYYNTAVFRFTNYLLGTKNSHLKCLSVLFGV